MWSGLKAWRRNRIVAGAKLDHRVWGLALQRFAFTRTLSPEERTRLRELTILFLHDKHFSTAHRLPLTDAMRLHVAVQACMLILNLGLEFYRGWSEIILYPAGFVPRHQYTDEMGVVHQGDHVYAGEAWLHGPVILSWADIAQSEYPDGVNVVVHEFAHKLDMLNGSANGYPPLHRGMGREAWVKAFSGAYADFCARIDRGEDTVIDPYASESPGEFFAVLSEAFFELPDVVEREYRDVYAQLSQFYRQDPLARMQRRTAGSVLSTEQ
ncbi:MAG TPA: M90 family metallopeptidase [Burkholderiales bacterium]|nr:M90 family metallopeptidase [Burkholderiales bacterium]